LGIGVLAALRHREQGGSGQRVEIDLLSSLLAALVNQASASTIAGEVPRRLGNAHPSIAPYAPLVTASGDLIVAVGTEAQFRALCAVLGAPELADEDRFATNAARVAAREELRAELEERLLERAAATWARELTAAGVPAGEVNDVAGAFALAESLGLEPTVEIPRAKGPPVRLARNPLPLSATPVSYRSAPPSLPQA
jgi:crotonobetainyl-CoA:carnitine CoA-transferase CaiB-like acyl-CoA transferase